MIIILSGSIGRLPLGGHAWIDMQYLAGLRALGHDVYYLEECGSESWVYNWATEQLTTDLSYPGGYVRECLERLGLGGKWIYRAGEGAEGMSVEAFREICSRADLLLLRAVPLTLWRPEYLWPRRRAFIDADPGFTQISLAQAKGRSRLAATVERCEHLFTIGQRIGAPDCPVPLAGRRWLKTVAPVSLPHWPVASDCYPVTDDLWPVMGDQFAGTGGSILSSAKGVALTLPAGSSASPGSQPQATGTSSWGTHFTTVMQWRGFHDVEYEGVRYGQKNKEFPRFMDLPRRCEQAGPPRDASPADRTSQPFLLALTGARPGRFRRHGWEVEEGWLASRTPLSYRRFIQGSRAEFSVAKQGYVKLRAGWFSDRSVCYLASGRPVLAEETGLDDWLPIGCGLLTFGDLEGAVAGVKAMNDAYGKHRAAARKIAEEYFSSERVLPPLVGEATA